MIVGSPLGRKVIRVDPRARSKNLAFKLKNDEEFYKHCSQQTQKLYEELYSEKVFVVKMKAFFNKLLNKI